MILKNWREFLWVDENKRELFHFLSEQIVVLPTSEGKVIYAADGTSVGVIEVNKLSYFLFL